MTGDEQRETLADALAEQDAMMGQPTFNQCELHGKCVDENWNDDKGVSHAGCLIPVPQPVLNRLRAARLLVDASDPESRRQSRRQAIANARAVDAARALVTDWRANGNSRELGDPTAETWHKAARQLLDALAAAEPAPNGEGSAV